MYNYSVYLCSHQYQHVYTCTCIAIAGGVAISVIGGVSIVVGIVGVAIGFFCVISRKRSEKLM